jgi:ATP-dependent Lon protease
MCYSLLDREALPVECSVDTAVSKKDLVDREDMLRTTGRIDEVMKEAASIASTYAKNFLYSLDPDNRFFEHVRLTQQKPNKKNAFKS